VLAGWTMSIGLRDRKPDDVRSFFTGATQELSLRLTDIAPRDLSGLSTALSSLGLVEEHFFKELARTVVTRSSRFLPEDLIAVTAAFEDGGLIQAELLTSTVRSLQARLGEVPRQDVLKCVRVLAGCYQREPALSKALGERLLRDHQETPFHPDEICSIAWGLASLGYFHGPLFRAACQTSVDGLPVGKSDALFHTQLYELHLAMKAFAPDKYSSFELSIEIVEELKAQYKKSRGGKNRDIKVDKNSEKVHKDIVDSLERVTSGDVTRQHQTELSFAVDIAVTRRKSTALAVLVEVDGPHSLLQSLDSNAPRVGHPTKIRGAVHLKRLLLQQAGHRIVVINEDLWRTLSSGSDKREFLRDLLKEAGVPKNDLR